MCVCVCSWGLFDATAGDWDWTALEVCGIPANLPPPIVHEATVVGTVSERVCAEWGLHIGPPGGVCEVFVAHGDHPCTVLASLRDGAAVGAWLRRCVCLRSCAYACVREPLTCLGPLCQ